MVAMDAMGAKNARDARDAMGARDAMDLNSFARYYINSYWWYYSWELSYLASSHVGAISQKNKIEWVQHIYDAFLSGAWFLYWTNESLYWFEKPTLKTEKRNNRIQLHSDNSPALTSDWGDLYFWHGTLVTEKIIMNSETITKEDILNERNSEVSRAIAEKLGWEEYLNRADTFLVDKWFDTEKCLHYELYDFKNRFDLMPKLLKMESPKLNNGSQPYYIEPVPPEFTKCEPARKWQIPKEDGTWPTIDECVKNPELRFEMEF